MESRKMREVENMIRVVKRNGYRFWWGDLKGSQNITNRAADGKIMLKWIMNGVGGPELD
jgi:glucan phosphoethanolaminetransferase (alkaline phosphatase superfamily)